MALAQRTALGRYVREVENAGALQLLQGRCQRMNLIIDAAQYVPRGSLVSKLVNRSEPIVTNGPGKIAKVLDATPAVSHGGVGLQVIGGICIFHVVEMGI